MSLLPASPEVLAILSALVEERIGLHYAAEDRQLLADKVSSRAFEAGFDSLLDYYYYLRYDDPDGVEMDALIDALVVRETYLFRELDQLEVIRDLFVAPRAAGGLRTRIWSAACATGEEPISLAMLLAGRGLLEHVDIVASDVSPYALERARSGRVSGRSVRRAPRPELSAPFLTPEGDRFRVAPEVLSRIEWRRLNLLDAAAVAQLGRFDVVLCRNVLIYFSDETVRSLLASLTRALAPGGALFVGVSESLMRFGTSLVCEEQRGVFLYREAA